MLLSQDSHYFLMEVGSFHDILSCDCWGVGSPNHYSQMGCLALEFGCTIQIMRTSPGVLKCITHYPLYIIQPVCLVGLGNFGALENITRIHYFTKIYNCAMFPELLNMLFCVQWDLIAS